MNNSFPPSIQNYKLFICSYGYPYFDYFHGNWFNCWNSLPFHNPIPLQHSNQTTINKTFQSQIQPQQLNIQTDLQENIEKMIQQEKQVEQQLKIEQESNQQVFQFWRRNRKELANFKYFCPDDAPLLTKTHHSKHGGSIEVCCNNKIKQYGYKIKIDEPQISQHKNSSHIQSRFLLQDLKQLYDQPFLIVKNARKHPAKLGPKQQQYVQVFKVYIQIWRENNLKAKREYEAKGKNRYNAQKKSKWKRDGKRKFGSKPRIQNDVMLMKNYISKYTKNEKEFKITTLIQE